MKLLPRQSKTIWLLPVFLGVLPNSLWGQQSNGEETVHQANLPPVVFSAMLWGKEGSAIFTYAPWDNHEDENATTLEVFAASGIVSKKFAYYGKGPLRLLAKEDNQDGGADSESNSSSEKMQRKVAASCSFMIVPGQTKEYILLIAPNKGPEGDTKARIYAIPFDRGRIPAGSFSFSSRASNTLYVEFGQKKFSLPPRNPVVQEAKTEENARVIPLKVYLRKSEKYVIALSQQWPHAKGLRGLVYLTETSAGVEVTRIADFPQPVERAIGYGIRPRIAASEDKQKTGQ